MICGEGVSSSTVLGGSEENPMSSLLEEPHRREAAARSEVDELRRDITELHERLAQAEGRLSRLECPGDGQRDP